MIRAHRPTLNRDDEGGGGGDSILYGSEKG